MNVITVCGSLKFKDEMMTLGLQMELAGHVILLPIFPINKTKEEFSEKELAILSNMHKEKIKLSDAILVIDIDSYIGNSTRNEIEFAHSLKKEVLYYTDLVNDF
ncbi:hypothetical protein ABID30_000475 [Enterococcus rotai]|uniref:DUF4406 domain-containing protein n=1 Tax=Enterococcus rotai TaxID=118060 RepID=A0A0U2XGH3_9ENTE|nr:hypothetical protein [Enterococcus rotai]ALS37857.1 hypothetical protein ATZ35_12075 [Enterococcus rotai]